MGTKLRVPWFPSSSFEVCFPLFFTCCQKECLPVVTQRPPGHSPINHNDCMLILNEFIMINKEWFEKLKFRFEVMKRKYDASLEHVY